VGAHLIGALLALLLALGMAALFIWPV